MGLQYFVILLFVQPWAKIKDMDDNNVELKLDTSRLVGERKPKKLSVFRRKETSTQADVRRTKDIIMMDLGVCSCPKFIENTRCYKMVFETLESFSLNWSVSFIRELGSQVMSCCCLNMPFPCLCSNPFGEKLLSNSMISFQIIREYPPLSLF